MNFRNIARGAIGYSRALRRRHLGYPFIHNANLVENPGSRKRALLVYLTEPFHLRPGDWRFAQHQNMRQSLHIAAALGEAGYVVDVADVSDDRHVSSDAYELVVSHRVDLHFVEEPLHHDTTYVYLASGMNHIAHNRNLRARYDALNARRGCHLQPLMVNLESMPFASIADAVAGFGNNVTVGSWREVTEGAILPFNNYGFAAFRNRPIVKQFRDARRNFLFLASRDQVGKGLDLLLEIFPRTPELHLYVCSAFAHEKPFVKCFEQELRFTPNIHPVGLVDLNSEAFNDLLSRCAFVILPSCSEGQPGSVVGCMHAGLIPLVTRECGIDLKGLGAVFSSDQIPAIEETVVDVASRPEDWHRHQSTAIRQLALDGFSEDAFLRRWAWITEELNSLHRKERR